jgi:hypothetical protein
MATESTKELKRVLKAIGAKPRHGKNLKVRQKSKRFVTQDAHGRKYYATERLKAESLIMLPTKEQMAQAKAMNEYIKFSCVDWSKEFDGEYSDLTSFALVTY